MVLRIMAKRKGEGRVAVNEHLIDRMVVCDFCTEASSEGKLLPCLHVFCKKCLENSQLTNSSSDVLLCPVCGTEFRLYPKETEPEEQLKNTVDTTMANVKGSVSDISTDGSISEKISEDLSNNFCKVCSKPDCKGCTDSKKTDGSKSRKGKRTETKDEVIGTIRPCGDCKEILCVSCLAANGKNSGIINTLKSSRQAIEKSMSEIKPYKSDALKKLDSIEAEKSEFLLRTDSLKTDINKAREELKRLVDSHADSLINEVVSWEQESTNAIKGDIEALGGYIMTLDKYNTNCMEALAKGAPIDAKGNDAKVMKNAELLNLPQLRFEGQMNNLHVYLQQTQIKDLFQAYNSNIIGALRDEEFPEFETKDVRNEDSRSTNRVQLENLTQSRGTKDGKPFKEEPALIRTLKPQPAAKDDRGILGLTVLENELYVVSRESSEVEVFDCIRLIFSCELEVPDLVNPEDITSCTSLRCLYIMDRKTSRSTNKILRIDRDGRLIRKWSTEDEWGHVSVTPKSNVLLSVYNRNKLKEYDPNGRLLRVLDFNIEDVENIRHAVKLSSGQFVVSHGETGDTHNRVLKIDNSGSITKSFNSEDVNVAMKRPFYLEIDEGTDSILIADADNGRILVLNSSLVFKREILSSKHHGLRYPVRICLNRSAGQLFVADNQVGNKKISVFQIK